MSLSTSHRESLVVVLAAFLSVVILYAWIAAPGAVYGMAVVLAVLVLVWPHIEFARSLVHGRPARSQFGLRRMLLLVTAAAILFAFGVVVDVLILLAFIAYTYAVGPCFGRLIGRLLTHSQHASRPLIVLKFAGAATGVTAALIVMVCVLAGTGVVLQAHFEYILPRLLFICFGLGCVCLFGDLVVFLIQSCLPRGKVSTEIARTSGRSYSRGLHVIATMSMLGVGLAELTMLTSIAVFVFISQRPVGNLSLPSAIVGAPIGFGALFAWMFIWGDNGNVRQMVWSGLPFAVLFIAWVGAFIGGLIGALGWLAAEVSSSNPAMKTRSISRDD